MRFDLNDLLNAKGVSEPLREAVKVMTNRLEAWENVFGHLGTPDEVGNEWYALSDRLEAAEKEVEALRQGLKRMCMDEDAEAKEARRLRADIEAAHSLLDNDESKIIRNAKDGYPEGREPKELTLTERVTALCKYAADWKRWCSDAESKIEAMEKQEPVGKFVQHPSNWLWEQDGYGDNPEASPLYALPGAQPAQGVPAAALHPVIDWLRNGCDPQEAAKELELLIATAAPEAKP